jgi:hypothetical protein
MPEARIGDAFEDPPVGGVRNAEPTWSFAPLSPISMYSVTVEAKETSWQYQPSQYAFRGFNYS